MKRDAVRTFCDRPPSEVAKLVAGPDVYICDACVALTEEASAGRARAPAGRVALARPGARIRCSFCGKRGTRERQLAAGPRSSVCSECLRLCRQILDSRAP